MLSEMILKNGKMLKKDYAKQSEGQKIGKKLNAEWWASKSGGGDYKLKTLNRSGTILHTSLCVTPGCAPELFLLELFREHINKDVK